MLYPPTEGRGQNLGFERIDDRIAGSHVVSSVGFSRSASCCLADVTFQVNADLPSLILFRLPHLRISRNLHIRKNTWADCIFPAIVILRTRLNLRPRHGLLFMFLNALLSFLLYGTKRVCFKLLVLRDLPSLAT